MFLSIFIFGSCTAADKAGIKSPIAKEIYNQLVQNQKDYDKVKSTDKDIFSKLRDFDQTPRLKKHEIEKLDISDDEKFVLKSKNSDNLSYFDKENLKKLIAIKPQNSWFKQSIIGQENAETAFLIIQHAPSNIQQKYYEELKEAALSKEMYASEFAMFDDRIRMGKSEKQLYGSQFRCENGKMTVYPIADFTNIDKRRKEMGFTQTFEEYKKFLLEHSSC
jgi:hypothetical protein